MKKVILFIALISLIYTLPAQKNGILKDTISLESDRFIGVDPFGAIYFVKEQVFYKKWNDQEWQFGDFSLGELTSVSILNPLKIILFYELSNTVIIVDKYLNEIDRVNFSTIIEFKNVAQVSPANANMIWIFNSNTQQLEVFDINSKKTIAVTQPISEFPIAQHSDFNYCWLLTRENLWQFNIYGSLLRKIKNTTSFNIKTMNNDLILQNEDGLYYRSLKTNKIEKINLPEIPIKQFYVIHGILYIYDKSKVYCFKFIPEKN